MTNQKANTWAKKLGNLPGVQAIFLSGSQAQGQSTPNSDIDFFIIARPGQIWTARFFVFLRLKLAGQLAKPHHHQQTICPNHFVTSDHLEIIEKDAYSAHLFSHNQPLFDPDNIFSKFAAQNQWVQKFGEKFENKNIMSESEIHKTRASRNWRLQKFFELVLKHLQTWITKRNSEFKTPGAKIILTDTELRFHPVPKNQFWKK